MGRVNVGMATIHRRVVGRRIVTTTESRNIQGVEVPDGATPQQVESAAREAGGLGPTWRLQGWAPSAATTPAASQGGKDTDNEPGRPTEALAGSNDDSGGEG